MFTPADTASVCHTARPAMLIQKTLRDLDQLMTFAPLRAQETICPLLYCRLVDDAGCLRSKFYPDRSLRTKGGEDSSSGLSQHELLLCRTSSAVQGRSKLHGSGT